MKQDNFNVKVADEFQKWNHKFLALNIREKLLCVGSLLAAIFYLVDFLWIQPLNKEIKRLSDRQGASHAQATNLKAEYTVLENIARRDPSLALQKTLEELTQKLAELDQQLIKVTDGLVDANKIPQILYGVLATTDGLRVKQLDTLPVEKMYLFPAQKNASTTEQDATQDIHLYKQSVEIVLSGDFKSIVNYVAALEAEAHHFYWDYLTYKVTDYPQADVTLRLFTLASEVGVLDGH